MIMTRVDFYQLQKLSLEKVLPPLLEKIYNTGHRAVILLSSVTRVEILTSFLWTYARDSWLPHGNAADSYGALQPLWLTTVDENPNGADILVLIDGMNSAYKAQYDRCLDIFDGNDPDALIAFRYRWKQCFHDTNFSLFYWKQTNQGSWQRVVDVTEEQ